MGPDLSPSSISSLQTSTFISWFLFLWLHISKMISVPWQSDLFPGKELGHSLKLTHFRERAQAHSPGTPHLEVRNQPGTFPTDP